jgi:hypothetical protein
LTFSIKPHQHTQRRCARIIKLLKAITLIRSFEMIYVAEHQFLVRIPSAW